MGLWLSWLERNLDMVEISGSSPLSPTKNRGQSRDFCRITLHTLNSNNSICRKSIKRCNKKWMYIKNGVVVY